MKKYPIIVNKGGYEVQVTRIDWNRIKSFQKAVLSPKEWEVFDKILMTEDKGKHIVGNQFYDWEGFIKKYPQYKESVIQLSINGFNTVMEFTGLKDGKLVVSSVLANIPYWTEME